MRPAAARPVAQISAEWTLGSEVKKGIHLIEASRSDALKAACEKKFERVS
jgi:hypothetical protein